MAVTPYLHTAPTNQNDEQTPRTVLDKLLLHTLNVFLIASRKITGHQLFKFLDTAWRTYDPEKLKEDNLHNETIRLAAEREFKLRCAYEENAPIEVVSWGHSTTGWDAFWNTYCTALDKNVPENNLLRSAGTFHGKERLELDTELRSVTDLAYYGLLFTAMHDPNFPALCKNKDLDASALTFEQKMDEELDHEALYAYLQARLGTA